MNTSLNDPPLSHLSINIPGCLFLRWGSCHLCTGLWGWTLHSHTSWPRWSCRWCSSCGGQNNTIVSTTQNLLFMAFQWVSWYPYISHSSFVFVSYDQLFWFSLRQHMESLSCFLWLIINQQCQHWCVGVGVSMSAYCECFIYYHDLLLFVFSDVIYCKYVQWYNNVVVFSLLLLGCLSPSGKGTIGEN